MNGFDKKSGHKLLVFQKSSAGEYKCIKLCKSGGTILNFRWLANKG